MKNTNTLCPSMCRTFRESLHGIHPGIWSLDLFPDADPFVRGPYASVADAHRDRSLLWHHGERHGRFIWVVTSSANVKLAAQLPTFHSVELTTDVLSMEVVKVRICGPGQDWKIITNRRSP